MWHINPGNEKLVFKTTHASGNRLFTRSKILYFFLTTAEGNAIIMRVQGLLAQLVRARR